METWTGRVSHKGWEQDEQQDIDSPRVLKIQKRSAVWILHAGKYAIQTRGGFTLRKCLLGNIWGYKTQDAMIWVFLLQHTAHSTEVMWFKSKTGRVTKQRQRQNSVDEIHDSFCQSTRVWNVKQKKTTSNLLNTGAYKNQVCRRYISHLSIHLTVKHHCWVSTARASRWDQTDMLLLIPKNSSCSLLPYSVLTAHISAIK